MDQPELASHYHLLEELGSGSFGVVYKAIELATGDVVAIKLIDLESSDDDIQEIQQEISVLSTCSSPFVTQYRTSFLRGHKLWIVMEFLGGGSCLDLLKPGPFNESHVAIVCRELLLGLNYLHQEGKIHRDIKAANVLLAQSGKVKLADFGVAAQLTNIKSMRNTFVGTPFWMAPEVIQEAGYDFKADIWSLGITAMELINGEPPNASTHPMKALLHIPKAPAPRLEGHSYSRDFKDFVATCLVKDPERRSTAKELLHHRFIRSAGKVEGLQELIHRKQMWDSGRDRPSDPKFYQETLHNMSPVEEKDDWVFETIKPKAIARPTQKKNRPTSSVSMLVDPPSTEELISRLTLDDVPSSTKPVAAVIAVTAISPASVSASTSSSTTTSTSTSASTVKTATKRRLSPSQAASPAKRKPSTSQRQPLAPDMSFGNSGSTVRLFRRVSDNSPSISPDASLAQRDENRPPAPLADAVTKEALLGRRVYAKVVDGAFQEVYAQTGGQARREKISRVHEAWDALDMDDPEGEWLVLRAMVERLKSDPKLALLLDLPATSQPQTPQKPKLVLAQNNPHLKSHRRRQSSIVPGGPVAEQRTANLPGETVPGLEHEKQLADVLYGKWVDGLKNRWPVAMS